jgi:hypothetical protein
MLIRRPALLWLSIFLCSLCCQATVAESLPQGAHATLEWAQLVPENWEPPIIAPAYDHEEAQGVDRRSLVSALHERKVRLPGFMKPQVFDGNNVSEFLLVPFLQHHIKHHAHLEPNQMVYVTLAEPLTVENPFDPIWVKGTITLKSISTDEGPAGYSMVDALAEDYTY